MREKRQRGQDKTESLFDYDLDEFDPKQLFAIDTSGVPASTLNGLLSASKLSNTADQQHLEALKSLTEASGPLVDKARPVDSEDPLRPEQFIGHHRRMEREERRMQMLERQSLMVTASRVRHQKEQLLRSDWRDVIDRIVRIHDDADAAEAKKKRELALQEISTFLRKFEEYNSRFNRRESRNKEADEKPKSKSLSASRKAVKAVKAARVAKARPQDRVSKPPQEPPPPVSLGFRPFAFGYMLPPRVFPPKEFCLPSLLHKELEAYDLLDAIEANQNATNATH